MWLHIVIFVILFLLAAGSRLGWLHVEQIGTQKGRKLFLAVALTGNIMAASMISFIPLLIAFIIASDKFIEGMTLGAVKG